MATLYDQLEELKKGAASEAQASEETQEEEEVEETEAAGEEPEAVAEPSEEAKPEVKAEEVAKEPVKEEEALDGQAFAKMRREAREAKAKAAELEQRLMAIEAAKQAGAVVAQQSQQVVDEEPNKAENFEGWVEWQNRQIAKQVEEVKQWKEQQTQQAKQQQLYSQAIQELTNYENEFKKSAADYDDVQAHFQKKLTEAVMVSNPSLSEADASRVVAGRILSMASDYAKRGLNPIEEMYNLTKERFGYTPPVKEQAKAAAPVADLKKIAENRKRAASPAVAAGTSSKLDVTIDDVGSMSLLQFAKLTPAQRQALKEQS